MPYVKVGKRFVHYWAPRPIKEATGQVVLMVHGAYDCQDYWKHVYAGLKAEEKKVPLGRWAQPEEYAYTVCFLASEESSFITGQCLSPNGGMSIVGF